MINQFDTKLREIKLQKKFDDSEMLTMLSVE